ncbi:MAG TPA: maltose ABC transporter permease MalF [Aggregatilineales bacterium]|nr:maltose ABC transporter permease MalF [Anaerolineae bacterium]HUN06978.1 maltose ABC transporter permease MalF [Aggregatilineales bacterium]
MSAAAAPMESTRRTSSSTSPLELGFRLLIIGLVCAIAFWLAFNIFRDGNVFLAVSLVVIALGVTVINLRPELWPLRWMTPGLAAIALLAVYPILYTVYVAFTNYGTGHRHTKEQAIALMGNEKFLSEGGTSYQWNAMANAAGEFALWLRDGQGGTFFAQPGQPLRAVPVDQAGTLNEDGIPTSFEGYNLLERREFAQALRELQTITFGDAANPVGIRSRSEAGAFEQRWIFDSAQNAMVNQETGVVYPADESRGSFVAADGTEAPLGYWVPIGLSNFTRIFNDIGISGPLVRVFLWTIAFAFFSVITSFALGLGMALLLDKAFPGVRILKSLLIIPYAIPGMISILIWRGMLNENVGIISTSMQNWFGWSPPFSTDPFWAKFAILLVNLWLSYPYFMLICSGALQSIPGSIYEAADVDGANSWTKFWKLTLPLLLVAVGPLLIASFTYNFNNFLLIEALFKGGPAMVGTAAPPVGHTDNLISYTYRFAFGTGGRQDYGFASAIAIVIFFIVGGLTLFQFRFTKRLEEMGEGG